MSQIKSIYSRFSHAKSTSATSNGMISRQNQISSPLVRQTAAPSTSAIFTQRSVVAPPPIVSIERLVSNFQNLGGSPRTSTTSSWAEAPEFVPRSFEGT